MGKRDDVDFDEFVGASWPSLFQTAFLLMGDYHLAEDVLQSALAKVYVVWVRVAKMEHPRSYTRTVVTNEAMGWWRRRSSSERPVATWPDAAVSGHEESVTQAHVVWQALQRLPPRQRAVIVLRYYEDLSEAEIATTLGISTGSVKTHAHHARTTLASSLTIRDADLEEKQS